MIQNNNKTVLFVFSLSAKKEAERKPLFGTRKKSISEYFFKLQNQRTLAIAKKSGVDVVWLDERKQEGNTFDERFLNAYKSLFKQGYENVISIGNDTPNLTTKHLKKAIRLLEEQQMVFGPSKDGGVYLLGYNKNTFDEKAFENLSWLTSNLSNEIRNCALKANISFSVLETLIDIDTKNSALEYAYTNIKSVISAFILFHIDFIKVKIEQTNANLPQPISIFHFPLRGPPSFL